MQTDTFTIYFSPRRPQVAPREVPPPDALKTAIVGKVRAWKAALEYQRGGAEIWQIVYGDGRVIPKNEIDFALRMSDVT